MSVKLENRGYKNEREQQTYLVIKILELIYSSIVLLLGIDRFWISFNYTVYNFLYAVN